LLAVGCANKKIRKWKKEKMAKYFTDEGTPERVRPGDGVGWTEGVAVRGSAG